MILGIEGAGHHFFDGMFQQSPSKQKLQRNQLEDFHVALMSKLYNYKIPHESLFSKPCSKTVEQILNSNNTFDQVVDALKDFDFRWKAKSNDTITLPLMSIKSGGSGAGMMSYPNFGGKCKPLQYPDVDLMHMACEAAEVTCKHFVLIRDAYQVIKSVAINRNFANGNILQSIKLHTTMLDVMNTQVLSHPNELVGYFDYGATEPNADLGYVLGYADVEKFSKEFLKEFKSPAVLSDEEKKEIIPGNMQAYMDVFIRSNNRLKKNCEMILSIG